MLKEGFAARFVTKMLYCFKRNPSITLSFFADVNIRFQTTLKKLHSRPQLLKFEFIELVDKSLQSA
jgi:hypothetical protein